MELRWWLTVPMQATNYRVPAFPSLQRLLESWQGKSVRDAAPRSRLCSFLTFGSCLFPGLLGMLGHSFHLRLRVLWAPSVQAD